MSRGQSVLGRRVGLALTAVILIANAVGAALVLVLAAWVLPTGPMADPAGARAANIALVGGYLVVAAPVGVLWGRRRFRRKPGDAAAQLQRERRVVLRERDRLRDLFGRQVGRDVASVAVAADEVRLGGELRRVAVLFVDLVGSTALTARLPPVEVVGLLNRFFGVVTDVVEECGGWINKFEGDAALAVFGAPAEHPDAAGGALAAGRVLVRRLPVEVPEVAVGIGCRRGMRWRATSARCAASSTRSSATR